MKARALTGTMAPFKRLTATKKLEIVRIAVYSAGEAGGLSANEAISVIAHLFTTDPGRRFSPEMIPTLKAVIEAATPRPRRRRP
jgi:hypothetical protein